jgi:HPt (histidine-containing phosphotransfer) domain-containing protein
MTRLDEAVRAGNREEAASAAHALKSSAFNVGAQRLGELCRELEAQARQGEDHALAPHLDALHRAAERAQAELAALCPETP